MTESAPEDSSGTRNPAEEADEVNTPGTGNTDLTGQAREIVESGEDSTTGLTPGGG